MSTKMHKKKVVAAKLSAVLAASLLLIPFLASAEPTYPPPGPAPSTESSESDGGLIDKSFAPSTGEVAPPPSTMPPLKDIPPAPMPYPPAPGSKAVDTGPGAPVVHDPKTGETIEGEPASEALPQAFGQGGYYAGADGGPGYGEPTSRTFSTKTLISNVGDSPWRMNVKVAFRRGTSWYVCSGALRDARTVQVAGHCVHEGSGGNWNDETWVFPGWDGNGDITDPPNSGDEYRLQTYGAAQGQVLGSWGNWINNGDFDYDWGVIELDRSVGFLTGWFGWEYGTSCPTATYNVAAYPAEYCGTPGLHNGQDMYYWYGTIDSCPGNQLRIDTTPGCFTALWGGESGSNLYRIDGTSRYVRGIASTSDRAYVGQYVNITQSWVDWVNNTFLPTYGRGATFDLEPLDMNVSPTTLQAGGSGTTTLNHLAANGTNGAKNDTFNFQVRLSTNDLISTSDTNLSNQFYSWNFTGLGSVAVNMVSVSIPENTPPGTYWLGVTYDSVTDSNVGNNDSSYWDAAQITVTQETNPPSPNPMSFSSYPHELNTSQIAMTATTATDPSGGIQYYFDYTSSPTAGPGGTDSGWQSSSSYTDSGLGPNEDYCYRVRARDTYGNLTSYSAEDCDYTRANQPVLGSFSNITQTSIQVNLGSDGNPSGTQYWIRNATTGDYQSWSTSKSWVSSGLTCGTTYTFGAWSENGDGAFGDEVVLGNATTSACPDTDKDGIPDMSDNCILIPNPTQCDADRDGYGNHCDADFNNDLIVNNLDIGPFRAGYGTTDPLTDLNCDGITNNLDVGPLRTMFGKPPGPSGYHP